MSGIGKSTFVRTIAGIWPYASGEIMLPKNKRVMYLPQKPYMPIGTLAEAILFPDKDQPELEKELPQILRDCNLESFIPRLRETASWSEQLSPGEQQRITFARIFLHKPDWVFLDESSSMLDLANEDRLYRLLKTRLPNCSIVSIGHRPSIDIHHEYIINMEKYSHQISH
jgi:vitamin B12/bleomycin/antimicrobial peptide transport system ATP-binding/permease protein